VTLASSARADTRSRCSRSARVPGYLDFAPGVACHDPTSALDSDAAVVGVLDGLIARASPDLT